MYVISGNSFYTALTVLLSWNYWMYLKRHMQLQGVPQPSPPWATGGGRGRVNAIQNARNHNGIHHDN